MGLTLSSSSGGGRLSDTIAAIVILLPIIVPILIIPLESIRLVLILPIRIGFDVIGSVPFIM